MPQMNSRIQHSPIVCREKLVLQCMIYTKNANAHSIDINNNKERVMLRAFTVPLANLRSRNEYKKFRPICCTAMLNLNS